MKTALLLVRSGLAHHVKWADAFAEGLERHGIRPVISTAWAPSDLLVVWGVRAQYEFELQRRYGQICVLERGYLGDRFEWTSVSFGGGLNGWGEFRGPSYRARFEEHFGHLFKPWRTHDAGDVLICGQVAGDASLVDCDIEKFYVRARTAFEAQGHTVRFREHPASLASRLAPRRSLADDLATARCVVTWNSNSAVEAVLAGVPAVVMNRGGMAWPVAGHELALPPKPDRTAWAHRLAWCQWREFEMRSGACWDSVGRHMEAVA